MITFTFGKYKGQPVDDVILTNPKYVLWAINNVAFFKLSDVQIHRLKTMLSRRIANWPCSEFSGWAERWAEDESTFEGAYGLD